MSAVKDLLLYSALLLFFINYLLMLSKLKKQKDSFLSILSHDLRISSIAQIRGIEVLEKSEFPTEEKIIIMQELKKSCNFSLDMINMLINNFKYDSKEKFLVYENFTLKDFLAFQFEDLKQLAYTKKIKFKIENEVESLYGDKNELAKLVYNLFKMVIERAENNSVIILQIKKERNIVEICINYQGKALSVEEQNRMFDKKSTFSTVGFGIQMNLCKNIINYHQGKIKFESKTDKNCFKILLPNKKKKTNKMLINIGLKRYNYSSNIKCFVNNLNNSSFQH